MPRAKVTRICEQCGKSFDFELYRLTKARPRGGRFCSQRCNAQYRAPDHTTHGESINHRRSTEYQIWDAMRKRCFDPKCRIYRHYGGRGITMCDRWKNSLVDFIADMGRRPSPQHSIDRINNDGNYEPGNCRWATWHEQQTNRRSTRWLTYQGETLCQRDWAKRIGISDSGLSGRLKKLTVAQALTLPVLSRGVNAR